ncbi:AAA family ATPase [Anatilimnocola sp. NA78]|uniref:AAA family ATPase n=1 Tax=Anatilimnocola sp. NA78 TaxID=3415683 RepID=UPI003CE4F55E
MEAVFLIGLPGSGKSSFYKERYFSTHVRISRDLLKTPHRFERMMQLCLETDQPFVIDNTNPSVNDRAPLISASRAWGFMIHGCYFQSRVADCLQRNAMRSGDERVPDVAILSKAKQLQLPEWTEGFERLSYVRIENGQFVVEDWQDEIR